ncbi:DUF4328 domain-containing protein [Dysgonomonas sp. Marseille-P4677]|uniref:DUF4328 domain-containing protein n=1 Tax=Dysgonomonas sp. Marseille-P4677 TaxID=2364790 RepID=UPI001912543A|nr:DUF4328 domain-containing protein [Dysgonomonas sp. Marseille-P4677]
MALILLYVILLLNIVIFLLKLSNSVLLELSYIGIYAPEIFHKLYYLNYQITYFIGYVYIAAVIISIITFIRWFRRAYFNLGVLTNECRYNDNWASNGWFVPFMNLYVPYQIMFELYEKTNNYLLEKYISLEAHETHEKRLNTNHIKWWWFLYIILFLFYSFQVFTLSVSREYGIEITGNTFYFLSRTGLLIILNIITISIIKNYLKTEILLSDITANNLST